MDEPVPVRRAAVGCLLIALAALAVALLVRPAIFTFAPERDDAAVIVATLTELQAGPLERTVVLSRSYGWAGEQPRDDGRAELRILVAAADFGAVTAVAATSPGSGGCRVRASDGRLVDCAGREWALDGQPVNPGDPPLDRFPAQVSSGSVTVDLTRRAPDASGSGKVGTARATSWHDASTRRT